MTDLVSFILAKLVEGCVQALVAFYIDSLFKVRLQWFCWDLSSMHIESHKVNIVVFEVEGVFRWFKFTLKPPYTITHGNLLMAIWDTSHWTSFVKFGLKTA